MSGFQLKIIATVSMLIDHTGAILFPNFIILRVIGRLAFPIYCFLLVQGFLHTSNLKKYMARMGIFVVLSEIPFDLALTGSWFNLKAQSVYITLFLGLCCMAVCRLAEQKRQPILMVIAVLTTCILSQLVKADYEWLGIAIIMIFYLLRQFKLFCYMAFIGVTAIYCFTVMYWIQAISIVALIPIYLYNGSRGRFSLRYTFYAFYPVHLLILYLIRRLIIYT